VVMIPTRNGMRRTTALPMFARMRRWEGRPVIRLWVPASYA
jgi:hypothetical protein